MQRALTLFLLLLISACTNSETAVELLSSQGTAVLSFQNQTLVNNQKHINTSDSVAHLSVAADVTEVAINEGITCEEAPWQPQADSYNLTLSPGSGEKKISFRYKWKGFTFSCQTDSVFVDADVPLPPTLSLQSTSPGNNQTPVVSVSGVSSGDIVKLFTDSSCATTAKATGTASGTSIQLTSSSLSEGSYTFYANRTDTVGNVSNCSTANVAYVVDLTAPSISNVTSSTAEGSYKAGGSLSIQIVFSEVLTVTGTPQLSMLTGRAGAVATYASGTGTNTLTFTYNVMSGDNSLDLDYTSTGALDLAGGSIGDVAGNALLVPLLPSPGATGSLSANKNIVLDTLAPTTPSALTLNSPSSSPGTVTAPIIQVSGVVSGDTVRLFSDSSCTTEKASGTVSGPVSGTASSTTILLTSSALSAGSFNFFANSTDAAGNISTCSSATVAYQLDLTVATITNVTASGNGPFKAGDNFTISIQFSKVVNVTNTPVLALTTTRGGAEASYSSGTASNTLIFSYTVVSPDTTSDLTYTATSSLALVGGTIKDTAGNDAALTLPSVGTAGSLSANQEIVLDTTSPTSPSISINAAAASTASTAVTLTLAATGASDMYITNTAGCGSGGNYETYATSKASWTLATMNATNTVYAKFKDLAGNETACVSDSILHDNTGPGAPTGLSFGTVPASDTTTPSLSWTAATDNVGGSGVAFYQAEVYKAADNSIIDGCSWTTLSAGGTMTCNASSLVAGTQYYMKVRAVDSAGNVGNSASSALWTALDVCLGTPAPGTVCVGGAIYLGSLNPGATSGSGVDKYMTSPGGCGEIPAGQQGGGSGASAWANADFTPTCSGTDALTKYWNDGSGNVFDISGLINYITAYGTGQGTVNTDQYYGSDNTANIVAIISPAQGGYHAAARYCDKLSYGGYADWYLPNRYELNLMFTNKASIPGLDTTGNWYWSSTESNSDVGSWIQRFDDGYQNVDLKINHYRVRCIRRY